MTAFVISQNVRKSLPSFFHRKRSERVRQEIEEASKETSGSSPSPDATDGLNGHASGYTFPSVIPTNICANFDAHEGEIQAVRWGPTGRILATGGTDRLVKLWDVRQRKLLRLYIMALNLFEIILN